MTHNFFMQLALQEAWKYQGLTYPNPSVGCVIVQNNCILSIQAHKKAGLAHGEVLALQEAYFKLTNNKEILLLKSSQEIHNFLLNNHNNIFKDISLYTTLEPCSHIGKTPSCANLISSLKIKKVFIGIKDKHSIGGIEKLKQNNCEVFENINYEDAYNLTFPFFKQQKDRFVFFKYASTLNANLQNDLKSGYISDKESLKYTHNLRANVDLLIIGGNTVRQDRPTLDCRFAKENNPPDVFIYSRYKDFDKSIALFNVKNRNVIIGDNISIINKYNNIMIEGSSGMMKHFEKYIDYFLVFLSSSMKSGNNIIQNNIKLNFIHQYKLNNDLVIWLNKKENNE